MKLAGGNDSFGMKLILPKEHAGLPVRVVLPRGLVNMPLCIDLDASESIVAVSCNQGSERGAPNTFFGMRAMRWDGIFMTNDPSNELFSVCSPTSSTCAYVMTHRYWCKDLNADPDGYSKWIRQQLRGDGKQLSNIGRDGFGFMSFEDEKDIDWKEISRYIARGVCELNPFAYRVYAEECVVIKTLKGNTPVTSV